MPPSPSLPVISKCAIRLPVIRHLNRGPLSRAGPPTSVMTSRRNGAIAFIQRARADEREDLARNQARAGCHQRTVSLILLYRATQFVGRALREVLKRLRDFTV